MRLHRFFVDDLIESKEVIVKDRDLLHQWRNVFRFQVGHRLILLNNSGVEYEAQILSLTNLVGKCNILSSKTIPESALDIALFAAMIKKDKYEWVLEKGTEIGISLFVPILAERSEKKGFNKARAERIIKEAAEQSGQGRRPILHDILTLDKSIEYAKSNVPYIVALDQSGKRIYKKDFFRSGQRTAIFVGPEGGWTDSELELFVKNAVEVATLGQTVLRAETASIAASAIALL